MISIIIPIYNVEQYLSYCIESLKRQTYNDYEVLLIDDGSSDRSGVMCDEYCAKDERFHVFHKANEGISAARNDGLEMAKGDFIYFMDSDDYIHPQILEVLMNALVVYKDADFSMVYGKKSNRHDEQFNDVSKDAVLIGQEDMIKGLFGSSDQEIQYQAIWNKLFRRSLISDLRFKDIVAEDVEFMMLVYLRTKRVALVPWEMYIYYQRPDSITHQDTNANNQIVRERFIHNLDTYYQIYTYIPEDNKQYKAWSLWKLYKRIFNVRFYASTTPYQSLAEKTIREIKDKTWKDIMSNSSVPSFQKMVVVCFYYFPFIYKLVIKI